MVQFVYFERQRKLKEKNHKKSIQTHGAKTKHWVKNRLYYAV